MFEFAWPWIFLLLPVPWLVYRYVPAAPSTSPALQVPFFDDVSSISTTSPGSSSRSRHIGIAFIWILLVAACARPQWIGEVDQIPVTGRDMMIAVDVSGSMKAKDMVIRDAAVDRLTMIKVVAEEFIRARLGDRVGLILFGTNAYLQSPLSFDIETVNTLLAESSIGIAGEKTAIGDAVGLAVKRLVDIKENIDLSQKVLILMTDGANTSGIIDPIKAATLAAQAKLKIYTIGVGAESMVMNSIFGQQVINPSSDLDTETLTKMAELTGGKYFRATDSESLSDIYRLIDQLEPINEDTRYLRPIDELFFWLLLAALCVGSLMMLFSLWPLVFEFPKSESSLKPQTTPRATIQ
jgi:Ca-activated chloride channel family protein